MVVFKEASFKASVLVVYFFLSTDRLLALPLSAPKVFNVLQYGAVPSGNPEVDEYGEDTNGAAFTRTWAKACQYGGSTKVVIPAGKYVVAQVIFAGPCKGVAPIVEVQGQLLANPDISLYPSPEWFTFENVDRPVLTASPTTIFDGQGPLFYSSNDCLKNPNCAPFPTTVKLFKTNNSVIEGIKSINSMFYHVSIAESNNVTIRNVQLQAPVGSPNTQGVNIADSKFVSVINSVISTGAECVSIGPGSTNVSVTGITCGPGLGIGVSGLGTRIGELAVRGVNVKSCTFNQSENGIVLKTLPGLVVSQASGLVFEDLVVENVVNPIVIDQGQVDIPSHVKIEDVTFRNITGISSSNRIISISCNKLLPCERVQVIDVNVKPAVSKLFASCSNAKVMFSGNNNGLTC